MTESLADLVREADAAAWDAQRSGRPDLRDLHWRYRDILHHLTTLPDVKGPTMTTTDVDRSYEAPDDLLLDETGAADLDMVGDYTDDASDEGTSDTSEGHVLPRAAGGRRYLNDLASAARASGLRVVEVAGWKTRGHGPMAGPDGIVCHHTGTSAAAPGNYPSLRVVRDGRPDLAGPLCNLGLGRDGTVYVVSAGRAYHAGPTFEAWQTNTYALGIEAEGDGAHPFPEVQYRAYIALCAALCEHYGIPTGHVESHKMIARPHFRKTDPFGVDMAGFRSAVAAARKAGPATTVDVPPRDPRFGHRGIPADLTVDGLWGAKTIDALLWYVGGDRLVGLTRMNVREVQTWLGRPRTGELSEDDVRALQEKTGSPVDGIWPRDRKSKTTTALQAWLNRRIADARKEA